MMFTPCKTPEEWFPPIVVLMGLGPHLSCLSREYYSWIEAAEVIVTGKDIQAALGRNHAVDVVPIKSPIDNVMKKIEHLSKDKKVLVIGSGDPLFFGIGRRLVERLGYQRMKILPNITYVQYLASQIALSWDDMLCFSLHGRAVNRSFFYWLRAGRKIALLTDSRTGPAFLSEMLVSAGFHDIDVVVGERLGTQNEVIVRTKPREVMSREWHDPNLVFVIPPSSMEYAGFFKEDLFEHDSGMITKREVRSIAVSALRLKNEAILWDLGAGSGSVSIEASYARPLSTVCAVEKKEERYKRLCSNVEKFRCGEIVPYLNDMLEIVDKLPRPDRIFIGGGGKSLLPVLDKIKGLFPEFPPAVVSAVTWDTVESVKNFARRHSLSFSVTQVSVNRSLPIMDSFRFEAINPIFLLTLGF